jgi:hypothetical protein
LNQTWHDPLLSGTNDTQELSKTYHQVTLARTRVWHSLRNHYFPLYFPEIESFIGSNHSDRLIQLLLLFPTPWAVTALPREEFIAQSWSIIGRKVHKTDLLANIYTAIAVFANNAVWAQSLGKLDQAMEPKHKKIVLLNNQSSAANVFYQLRGRLCDQRHKPRRFLRLTIHWTAQLPPHAGREQI